MRSTAGERVREQLWEALLAERGRAQRVALSRCATRQDAEDCVQEAMARVAAMPAVDIRRIGPLLATVTANLAADSHRRAARTARVEPRLRAAAVPDPTPEEIVCDAEEARWLWRRREVLGLQDREVLELRAQGRSVSDAAAALGLTYKATEASFTRARSKMRAIWRATAASIGIMWGRRHRPHGPAAAPPVAVAAAAAVALVLLPAWQEEEPARPGSGAGAAAADAPVSAAGQMRRNAAAPRDDRGSPAGEAVAPPAPTTAAPPEHLVRAEPVVVGPVDTGDVAVTRKDEDETFLETVERCLESGVAVSPTSVGCRR